MADPWAPVPESPDLNITGINASVLNHTQLIGGPWLKPVTLLHLEWNGTTPTGVRYMAFDPKIIEISTTPLTLAILAGVACAVGAVWYLSRRRGDGG